MRHGGVAARNMADPSDDDLRRRNAQQVLDDHLRLRQEGDLEGDLRRNYAEDVVVLTSRDTARGHDGVRSFARLLYEAVSEWERFEYHSQLADDRVALLEWSADADAHSIRDGVDSFLIENGKIRAQTIRYTVVSSDLSVMGRAEASSLARQG